VLRSIDSITWQMSGPMSDISLSRDAEVLVEEVSSIAAEVDCNSGHDSRIAIRKLASRGLLDLGLPGSGGTYSDQIRVLSDLASVCMTTAFTAWSHRMTVEYLVSHGGDDVRTDDVRNARRVGSTALAGTLVQQWVSLRFRSKRVFQGLVAPQTVFSRGHRISTTMLWSSRLSRTRIRGIEA